MSVNLPDGLAEAAFLAGLNISEVTEAALREALAARGPSPAVDPTPESIRRAFDEARGELDE